MQTKILVGLFFCHLLADFTPMSTEWMLHAKKLGKPLLPILIHALVHAVLMGLFLYLMGVSNYLILAGMQWGAHFIIDIWKGRMNGWFPALQTTTNKWFWILFGVDQYFHALVIIFMVYSAK
jgi:hypothetical protein